MVFKDLWTWVYILRYGYGKSVEEGVFKKRWPKKLVSCFGTYLVRSNLGTIFATSLKRSRYPASG